MGNFGDQIRAENRDRAQWSGTIKPISVLYPADGEVGQALFGQTALSSSVDTHHYGCQTSCSATVDVFSEPAGGWRGVEVSQPAISTGSGTSILPLSLQGSNLFLTGGGTVDVYDITGRYGTKASPPSALNIAVSGLSSGRPRLRFTITTKAGDPTIRTLTIRPPRGLAFTSNQTLLARGVAVARANPTRAARAGALRISALPYLSAVKITVLPQALTETKQLKLLIQRLAAHPKQTTLAVKIQATPTVGTNTTLVLRLHVG